MDLIFPPCKLCEAEEVELIKALSSPALRKYLIILATSDSKDLLSLNILDMLDKDIANRHHFISGKLSVISTLLSIT